MPAAKQLLEKKRKREAQEPESDSSNSDSDSSSSDEEVVTKKVEKTSNNGKVVGKKEEKKVESNSSSEESSDSESNSPSDADSSDSDSDSDTDSSDDEKVKKEQKKKSEAKKAEPVKATKVQEKAADKTEKKTEVKGKDKPAVEADNKKRKTEEASSSKKSESKVLVTGDPVVDAWRKSQNLSIQGDNCPAPYMSFSEAPFPDYISNALKSLKFEKPTPIQAQAWPLALGARDMIGLAETGSGKTLAFILPAVVHICNKTKAERSKGPSVLVLAPTRELAQQIEAVTSTTCTAAKIKSCCVYGGVPKHVQAASLKGAEVIIATPGRLIDFMSDGTANLANITYLVFDEADRMLDMGFELQINEIMRAVVSPVRQTLMFSATWPSDVQRLSQKFFTDPIKITIGSENLKGAKKVTQIVEVCQDWERKKKLKQLLEKIFKDNCRILIFMLYKKSCSALAEELARENWPVGCINGDMSQNARDNTLAQFKSGKQPIMIATDVAARGLDIKEVKYVINVEFPLKCEDYVHRIGRTGRAGEAGTAYTFFTESDKAHARELLQILRESGQEVDDKFLGIADKAPGIKPKKTALQEMYGDFAKGKNLATGKAATRIVFD